MKADQVDVFDELTIGFAVISLYVIENNTKKYDLSVYIQPEHRRKCYASLLTNYLEEFIHEDEKQLIVGVNMLKFYDTSDFYKNTDASSLYVSLGYNLTSTIHVYRKSI